MSLAEPSEGWLVVTIPTRQHAASLALPSEKTSGQPLLTAHWAWPGVDRHHIKKKKTKFSANILTFQTHHHSLSDRGSKSAMDFYTKA